MKNYLRLLSLVLAGLLLVACTTNTTVSGSWSDPAYEGQVKTVYLIGMSENIANRYIFEDTFSQRLATAGVSTIPSYVDFSEMASANRDEIRQRLASNGADSVLLTRLVAQRTEKLVIPKRFSASGYTAPPSYHIRPTYYSNWGRYYNRPIDVTYQPPDVDSSAVITVESVLYDVKSEKLIWAAQLETLVDGSIERMMREFVETVTHDLKSQGLI